MSGGKIMLDYTLCINEGNLNPHRGMLDSATSNKRWIKKYGMIYRNHKDYVLQASRMINTSHFILKLSSGGHELFQQQVHTWMYGTCGLKNGCKWLKKMFAIKQVCLVCHPPSVTRHQEPLHCVAAKCYMCVLYSVRLCTSAGCTAACVAFSGLLTTLNLKCHLVHSMLWK